MPEFKKVLIAVDFSDSSRSVIRQAMELAPAHSEVTVLHIHELPNYAYGATPVTIADWVESVKVAAAKELRHFLDSVAAIVPNAKGCLRSGDPVEEILAAIDELHPDLVVLGTHGRRGKKYLFLGSVAERVVRGSPVPVLTVRQHTDTPGLQ